MNNKINKTGLLLVFIGLIINLVFGFGAILSLVGLFMTAGQSDNLRRSRNYFIGTMCVAIGTFIFMIVGVPVLFTGVFTSGSAGAVSGAVIGVIVFSIIIAVCSIIFNYYSYKYLLYGCMETVPVGSDEYNSMSSCYRNYKRSLLITYIGLILASLLSVIPVLNVILLIVVIVGAIYMFVCNIWIIVSVFKAYRALDNAQVR